MRHKVTKPYINYGFHSSVGRNWTIRKSKIRYGKEKDKKHSALALLAPHSNQLAGYAYQKHQAKDDRKEAKSRQEEIKTPQGPT
jgi:hypothetical protein